MRNKLSDSSTEPGIQLLSYLEEKPQKLKVHFDIEINYLSEGNARYFMGRGECILPERRLVAFWGGTPHRLVATSPTYKLTSIRISLLELLRIEIARPIVDALLEGGIACEPMELTSPSRMERWVLEASSSEMHLRQAALLEIQAAMLRSQITSLAKRQSASAVAEIEPVIKMCRFISTNLSGSLSSTDVADVAGLHPNYAMRLFKRLTGMTIQEYVVQSRMATAQRLLLRSSGSVEEIGEKAGFQCASQYYATFKRMTGITPLQFRKRHVL